MEDHLFFYFDSDDERNQMERFNELLEGDAPSAKANQLEGIFLLKNRKVRSWKEMASHCVECLEPLHYSDEYDARYCKECDEWREMICDPNCETCQSRPVKPSQLP